jgi:hypothetical protein
MLNKLSLNKINIIALIAGISTLLLIAISVFVPWWQFIIGKPTVAQISFSPVNFNFTLLGTSMATPLIWATNLACFLTLASGGIIMLIYSLKPNKSYSKKLLGFGYKQPVVAVILFVIELIALTIVASSVAGFNVPLQGAGVLQIPQSMTQGSGVNVSVNVIAALEWPFYFAIIVAGLCITTRLYQPKKLTTMEPSGPFVSMNN